MCKSNLNNLKSKTIIMRQRIIMRLRILRIIRILRILRILVLLRIVSILTLNKRVNALNSNTNKLKSVIFIYLLYRSS